MSRELLEKLLDHFSDGALWHDIDETNRLRNAVKAELAKPEPEPFGYFDECFNHFSKNRSDWTDKGNPKPLYENPSNSEIEQLHSRISDKKSDIKIKLHDEIMTLSCSDENDTTYKLGYWEARHDAANLAANYDTEIEQLHTKKFPWGKVIDRFTFDFDGEVFEVTKYNPWISRGSGYVIGTPSDEIEYHCEELHQSARSLMALLIHWIAFKNIGSNNGSLAEGICRALCVELENK